MHLPGTRTTIALVLLAALGLLGVGAGPAAAADGDPSWEVATASGDLGSDRPNYSYTLEPGGRIEDGLVVANHGTTPLHLAVYAADGFTTGKGRLDLLTRDAKSTRVGAWVHTDRPGVTVGPGASAEVPFTVALPDDAASGEYMGGIVTSLTQAGAAERRLGIRIRLRVGGDLRPRLSITDLHVRYAGTSNPFGKGGATVTYTIHNTGNAILGARQTVSVSGPFGSLATRPGRVGDSPQLLPGDSWKVSVPVRGVAATPRLTGTVTLVPLLTDASGSVAPLAAVKTTADTWSTPWAPLLLLVVLAGLVLAALAFRRRRRAGRGEDARVQDADEQPVHEPETSAH